MLIQELGDIVDYSEKKPLGPTKPRDVIGRGSRTRTVAVDQDVERIFGLMLPELIYGNDFGGHLDSKVEERRRRTTKIGKGN